MSRLTSMGVAEIAAAIKSKQASAWEVLEAHLARIDAKDGAIGAFLARNDASARSHVETYQRLI